MEPHPADRKRKRLATQEVTPMERNLAEVVMAPKMENLLEVSHLVVNLVPAEDVAANYLELSLTLTIAS
jgi:hypothetical protein